MPAAKQSPKPSKSQLSVMQKDFNSLDADKSGFISGKELEKLVHMQLGRTATDVEVRAVSTLFDTNEDGKISFQEWVDFVFQPTEKAGDDEVRNLGEDFNLTKTEIEKETKEMEESQAQSMEVRAMCQMLAKFNSKKGFYDQDAKGAKRVFQKQAGADGKGNSISAEEFRVVLKQLNFSEVQIEEIFSTFDLNASKDIDYKEFVNAFEHYERFSKMMKQLVPKVLKGATDLASAQTKAKECFKQIQEEKDDDLLTPSEFSQWLTSLGCTFGKEDVDSMFMVLDADGSERIRCGEFVVTLSMQAT